MNLTVDELISLNLPALKLELRDQLQPERQTMCMVVISWF